MARIVLLTGSSLCHNPRALKEAATLARAGHEVRVLGAWLEPGLKARDARILADAPFALEPVLDVTRADFPGWAKQILARAAWRGARFLHAATGRESSRGLGPTAGALRAAALRARGDLFIAHSEPGLYAAAALMVRGARVGVDMEDWFSEDLPADARRGRPVDLLRHLERDVLRGAAYASTTSRVLGAALAEAYGCAPPITLYNAFPWSDRTTLDRRIEDRRDARLRSIYWFSTTIGPGRGLEELMAASAELSQPAEIHLRGRSVPGFEAHLRAQAPEAWRERIFFHPLAANEALLSRIAEHDIGVAGERRDSRSRDLTVTNKLLHYLLGGLAVVASDTAGQREIAAAAPRAIVSYVAGDSGSLAAALNALLESPERLSAARAAALEAAHGVFNWERQEPVLIAGIERALARAPAPGAA
ncbi:MAG TPA: glycosyl transferase family 1 [Alphaproteobacteria bacterium]|nr:glycosyl transferase family 1 [Alphaproteobacteria bacterium]